MTFNLGCQIGEFKQITTAGATTAAVTEKVWGEYCNVMSRLRGQTYVSSLHCFLQWARTSAYGTTSPTLYE